MPMTAHGVTRVASPGVHCEDDVRDLSDGCRAAHGGTRWQRRVRV